jgi:hypothetical protein
MGYPSVYFQVIDGADLDVAGRADLLMMWIAAVTSMIVVLVAGIPPVTVISNL